MHIPDNSDSWQTKKINLVLKPVIRVEHFFTCWVVIIWVCASVFLRVQNKFRKKFVDLNHLGNQICSTFFLNLFCPSAVYLFPACMWTHLHSPLADKPFVNMDFSLHPLADSPPQFGCILAASPTVLCICPTTPQPQKLIF